MAGHGGSWRIPATSPTRPASMVSELQFAAATSAHGDGFLGDKLQPARDLWTSSTRRRFRRWEWDPGEDDVHCKNQELNLQDNRLVRRFVEDAGGDQIQEVRIGAGSQSHGDRSDRNLVDYQFPADEEWRARLRADEEEWRARCRADDERWEAHVQASDERWESLLRAFKERLNSCMPTVRSNFQDDEVEEESLVDDASIWSEYEDDEDAEEDALPAISPARASRMPTVIRRHFAHPPDVRLNSQGTSLDLVSSFTIDSTLVWGGDDDQSEEENEEEIQSVVDEGSLGGGNGNWNEIVEDMMIAEGVRRNVLPHLQLHDPTLEVESQGQRRNEKDWKVSDVNPKKKNHHALHCEESENDELLAWDIESIGDFIDKDQAAGHLKISAPSTTASMLIETGGMLPSASGGGLKPDLLPSPYNIAQPLYSSLGIQASAAVIDDEGRDTAPWKHKDNHSSNDNDNSSYVLSANPTSIPCHNPGEKDKNASHADGISSVELLEILDAEEDDLPFGLNIDSGTLACVACGILGYPFMAIVQPSEAVTKELFPVIGEESHMRLGKSGYSHIPSCFPNIAKFVPEGSFNNLGKQENSNSSCKASPVQFDHFSFLEGMHTFDGPEFLNDNGLRGSMNTKTNPAGEFVLSNAIVRGTKPFAETHSIHGLPTKPRSDENMKWTLSHGFNRPRIFCLQHALEVEELLHSKGGAHMLVICHSDYLKIKAYIPSIAEEVGRGINITDVPLENASPSDLNLINISIDDGKHEEQGED